MTHLRMVMAVVVLAGCDVGRHSVPEPTDERFEHDMMVRFHMHQNFDLMRGIERLLIRGKLDDAKAFARTIAIGRDDPGLSTVGAKTAKVRDLARALADSPSTDEACRREARLAVACADCHAATGALPLFDKVPTVPADGPTLEARMARHQWAADRMWEGTVGGSDDAWRAGAAVLAGTPFPFAKGQDDRAALAKRLQQLAEQAGKKKTTDTMAERGRVYGEMLVVCASCHSAKPAPVLPSQR